MKLPTVIFDIDGTLADIAHRRVYLDEKPKNWARFNNEMGADTPNNPIVRLYKTLWDSGAYKLEIVTGRDERFREVTEQWLTWNDIPFKRLSMRGEKDYRADHIIKKEILDKFLSEGANILFCVDDRAQVVNMWRENGITCLQCDVGDF